MNIAVIGSGYVGLVTGTCLAETGNNVICVDIDEQKIERMKNGEVPIYEPHLDNLFARNIKQNRLTFTTDLADALKKSEIIFLALPTPPDEDGSADLKYVLGVAKDIAKLIDTYKIIITKSTVPVGTAEKVNNIMRQYANEDLFDVVSNPEFLREGFAVDDFLKPDRIVIGTTSEKAKKTLEVLYAPYVRSGNPIIFMDEKSSELTKYAANSFLATKITFMNEIANFCELVGADVDKVRMGMGSDSRIGKRFLFPGIGYGGSCFPKDVKALAKSGEESSYKFEILNSVLKINDNQYTKLTDKVFTHFNQDIKKKHFAIWGLAFKPDTDDIREAPSLKVIDTLLENGASVSVYDPEAMENVKALYGDKIQYGDDHYSILKDANALIINTEWSLFRLPNFDKIKSLLKANVIFDGRNIFKKEDLDKQDILYYSIGR